MFSGLQHSPGWCACAHISLAPGICAMIKFGQAVNKNCRITFFGKGSFENKQFVLLLN